MRREADSALAYSDHFVFLEHQAIAVNIDFTLADDPASRWHA